MGVTDRKESVCGGNQIDGLNLYRLDVPIGCGDVLWVRENADIVG